MLTLISEKNRLPFAFALLLPSVLLLASCASEPQKPADSCSQPRLTVVAPAEIYHLQSPLADSYDRQRARRLYEGGTTNDCAICHGKKGDGRGLLAGQFSLPPRNFTCKVDMSRIPDGQLFWIIRNGSEGTAMPSHEKLSDEEIWQLVAYLRELGH